MNSNSTDLRIIKTRQNIKNAVLKLITEKPVSSITITEVAKSALINRKTFYRHYESVEAVIIEIEDDILETLLSLLNKNNSSCLEVGVVLRYIGTTIEMNKDTIYKMIKMSPEYIYSGRLKELLRKSTEVSVRSVVEVKSEKTLKILSQFLVTGVLSVYSDWLINGCKESIDFIVDVTRTIAYGCLVQFIPQDKLKNIDLF